MTKEATGSTQKKTYIVRRAFDNYVPGDVFEPTGNRNDNTIVEFYCDIVYNRIIAGQCPTCGKKFKRLDMHKCEGG